MPLTLIIISLIFRQLTWAKLQLLINRKLIKEISQS